MKAALRSEKNVWVAPTAFVHSVEVYEHGANSAICRRGDTFNTNREGHILGEP